MVMFAKSYNIRDRTSERKEDLSGNKQFSKDICKFFCINTFVFMLTYVQTQFKSSSRKRDEHVKQHEARTLNELNNVNVRLKKRGVFPLKKTTFTAYCLLPVNTK